MSAPVYRDGVTAVGTTSSAAATIPVTIQVGDVMVLVVMLKLVTGSGLINTPAGWTALSGVVALTGAGGQSATFYRVATVADPGSTLTVTGASSQQLNWTLEAYSGSNGTVRAATFADNGANSTNVAMSAATTATDDIVVGVLSARTASNASVAFSAPAGYNMRHQVTNSSGAAQNIGTGICDSTTFGAATATVAPSSWSIAGQVIVEGISAPPPTPPTPTVGGGLSESSRFIVTSALTNDAVTSPFDLPAGRGQRTCTFAFDLVDAASGQVLGSLQPTQDQIPVLGHDTTRTIKRQVTLSLNAVDTAAIDTIKDRVRIRLVLPDGRTFPLGLYMFTDNTRAPYTSRRRQSSAVLMDEMFIIDQPRSVGFPNIATQFAFGGAPIDAAQLIQQLLEDFPNIEHIVEGSPYIVANTWGIGTSSGQVLGDLADFGDYFPAWLANDEKLHMIRSFDPTNQIPSFDWDTYSHVYADTIAESDDLLTAPNRIIVNSNDMSDATAQGPITGTYDIPASAPHSIQNRGFVVPDVYDFQLSTQAQAAAVARNIGLQQTIYQRTTLSTAPDPRHDSYDVIRWQGQNWLELAWSMDLIEGGTMSHTLRKTYR
jgi:hypothetical protein